MLQCRRRMGHPPHPWEFAIQGKKNLIADGIDRCIIIPPRKCEAVIHCSVLWFTTGRIPADAKGATVAELDEPVDRNKIENRSQNKILFFFCGGITTSYSMVWHIITFCSLIVIYFTQLAKYPRVLYAKLSNKVYAIG